MGTEQLIEVLNEYHKVCKPVALWPDVNVYAQCPELIDAVAKTLGLVSFSISHRPLASILDNAVDAMASHNANVFFILSPWYDSMDKDTEFTYRGKQYTMRGGDPRAWTDDHESWWTKFRSDVDFFKTIFNDDKVVWILIDYECWQVTQEPKLNNAIRTKCGMVADYLEQAWPDANQLWDEKWGWRDLPGRGWTESCDRYPSKMPGEYAHVGFFQPNQPYALQKTFELMSNHQQVAINLCLEKRPRVGTNPGTLGTPHLGNWAMSGVEYPTDYSWLLGMVLGNRLNEHPVWAFAQNVEMISIEPDVSSEHLEAFIRGMLGWQR